MTRGALAALLLGCGGGFATVTPAAEAACRATSPLQLRVRFANETPRAALLESLLPGGLRLLDPLDRHELWSAGADAGHTLRVAGMNAAFGSSLTAVHLDADGLQDRIYAGDRAGRLWRFDLHAGAAPASWARATLLADLGAPGRGFVAAPDVTRIATDDAAWLNIAIGTANTGAQRSDNRFFVLRDTLDATVPATALLESDLEPLLPPLDVSSGNARGYYLRLGDAQVLAQALTLDGRVYFTAIEAGRALLASCVIGTLPTDAVPLSVTALRAKDGAVESRDATGHQHSILRRVLADELPAAAGVQLTGGQPAADGRLPCRIEAVPVPDCFLDTWPHRSWWRREDAD